MLPEITAGAALYDPTYEQEECDRYHRKLSPEHDHQLLSLDAMMPDLDVAAMYKAFEILVRRHESLRTFFPVIDGRIRQCVLPFDRNLFTPHYVEVAAAAQEEIVRQHISEGRRQLRRLDKPPLIHCYIFGGAERQYYLYILIHHIISDVWSSSIIYQELGMYYDALRKGRPLTVPPLKMQLRDYATWQSKWLRETTPNIIAFWAGKFRDLPLEFRIPPFSQTSGLPLVFPGINDDRDRVIGRTGFMEILDQPVAGSYEYIIGPPVFGQLKALAIRNKSGMGSVMNLSLQLLFTFLTDKKRILLAMPIINRFLPGSESIIGCLGGGAYIYQPLDTSLTVSALVKISYQDFLEAAGHLIYEHDEMQVDGTACRINCDAFVNFSSQEMNRTRTLDAGRDGKEAILPGDMAYYALSCYISEYDVGLYLNWKYNLTIYRPDLIRHMAALHRRVLALMGACPDNTAASLLDSLRAQIE